VNVEYLQRLLNTVFHDAHLALDGRFGPGTMAVVHRLQQWYQLTGEEHEVGPRTWEALLSAAQASGSGRHDESGGEQTGEGDTPAAVWMRDGSGGVEYSYVPGEYVTEGTLTLSAVVVSHAAVEAGAMPASFVVTGANGTQSPIPWVENTEAGKYGELITYQVGHLMTFANEGAEGAGHRTLTIEATLNGDVAYLTVDPDTAHHGRS
jgi:peptidoglycan hydrolase-like protein with peptidoglycan-binding domain